MFITTTAVILRICANSYLNTGQKKLSVHYSSLNVNFKTYLLLSIFALPVFFIMYFKSLNLEIFLWAVIGGVFGALGNAFLISALKNGELSILGPVNSYKAIVGLIFGVFIIKELPNMEAVAGIFLIIFGSYFVFNTTKEGFSLALFKRKDIQHRLYALVFTGLEAVFIKKVIILSDVFCSFLLWVIFGCIFSFLFLKAGKKRVDMCNLKPFAGLSALVLIMQLSTNYVFMKLPVAAALSMFQLSNILNVFLGYKIFNEKHLLKKLTGSIIMIIGSIIILYYA